MKAKACKRRESFYTTYIDKSIKTKQHSFLFETGFPQFLNRLKVYLSEIHIYFLKMHRRTQSFKNSLISTQQR